MMIYVDDWISVDVKEYFSNPEYMNNPIVMFYLCMKYYPIINKKRKNARSS